LEATFDAWKGYLLESNKQILHQRLANPVKHNSQFPELKDLMECGRIVNEWMPTLNLPAYAYATFQGGIVFIC
jgi:hypothetical protein